MNAPDPQKLFEELLACEKETAVVGKLEECGYWKNPDVWRDLGDEPENYSTAGNQQSRAEQALIEKLVNAIDTKLIAAARIAGVCPDGPDAPDSLFEARNRFFERELENPEELSKSITVAATGERKRPSITIVDDGEGQSPSRMPHTILSLLKGNKKRIPFVQGKFNMGGTGVLEFCGVEHNVQLILSRQNPALQPNIPKDHPERLWSFTIIRREDPSPGSPKGSHFTFLAPGPQGKDGKKSLLTFDAPELSIFPVRNQPYARNTKWGTLFKLYEYGMRAGTNMMLEGGLMGRVRLLLPDPALPIRFHECRNYKGHEGSYDTTMIGLINTLDEDRKSAKRKNVEWFDKFVIDVAGEKFTGYIYLFRKQAKEDSRNPIEGYRKDEGVVFVYNGQTHAYFSKDFFRRNAVKQDYLWNSLLVFIDCSKISIRGHEKLFMPSRDRLRDGDLKRNLEKEIEDKLKTHKELEKIANERRKQELADQPEASETMEKFVEEMLKNHPLLEKILELGSRIKNPFKPHSVEAQEKEWTGLRFPTKFRFKNHAYGDELSRGAPLNSHVRIAFETDAEDEYFRRDEQPGEFDLYEIVDGQRKRAKNWKTPSLYRGNASLSIVLPENAEIGKRLSFEAHTTDPSRVDPFINRFTLEVKAARPSLTQNEPRNPRLPGTEPGEDAQNDTKLNIPNPIEIFEKDWGSQDPPFDKFTVMTIKRPPGVTEGSVFDYRINMDNIYVQTAIKGHHKRAGLLRNRYKFGMTMLSLALIRHDIELRKQTLEEAEEEGNGRIKQDIRETVAEVTKAIAPFFLPLVDSLAELPEDMESLSASAGEAA